MATDELAEDARVPVKRLLIVTNVGWFFLSHRLPLAMAARAYGFEVHVAAGIEHPSEKERIDALGFPFHEIPVIRGGMNPFNELRVLLALVKIYRELEPAIVHHVAIKAVLYGGIAARIAGVRRTVSSFTGMGYLFDARALLPRVVAAFVRLGLRVGLRGVLARVIVQNRDHLERLVAQGLVARDRIDLIRGSGVDLKVFGAHALPSGTPVVLLVGRMLVDKGVREFLDAAELLLNRKVVARFLLAGGVDSHNPASLSSAYLESRQRAGQIEWLGQRNDVPELMRGSTIVCLPSYHEGLPKTLLEAAATGRPMVATDIPGCREVVVHDVTGLLVPRADVEALATALESLITDPAGCARMGAAARAKAEAEFGVEQIVERTLAVYTRLLDTG